MTITNGYATLADYYAWMSARGLSGSVTTDPSDDGVIETLIEAVSRDIERMTGRKFWADSVDATRYYTAKDATCLQIDDLSAAPTSVSVDYTEGLRTYTALTASQYDLAPDNALLDNIPYREIVINPVYAGYFPLSRRGVRVVGKFGFPSVPKQIKEATLATVQNINSSRSGQNTNGRVTVTSAGVVIRSSDYPDMALKVIEGFRFNT